MTELPICEHRKEQLGDGMFLCQSPKLIPSPGYRSAEYCSTKCLYHDKAPLHESRVPLPLKKQTQLPSARTKPCQHLGKRARAADGKILTQQCQTCSIDKFFDLCECRAGHGNVSHFIQCQGCADYREQVTPADAPPVRHLLYHILPCRGNQIWQRNLDQLLGHISLFNGRRIVAVATPATDKEKETIAAPKAVEERLRGYEVDVIRIPNDARLREVASWVPLWERLQDCQGANDFTFYAHAKGVTRPVNPGVSVHPWSRVLYSANLDFWPVVQEQLAKHPITGALKKVGHGFQGSASTWHYSGTFYWIRNADFFARDWRRIDQQWWGTESFPGVHYSPEEAGCIFHSGHVPQLNMYSLGYVNNVEREFEEWTRKNSASRSAIGLQTAQRS